MARDKRWLRLRCAGCGKPRVFREADLISRQSCYLDRSGDVVTVTKPCPFCGNDRPLPIRRPPYEMPTVPRTWRLGTLQLPGIQDRRPN